MTAVVLIRPQTGDTWYFDSDVLKEKGLPDGYVTVDSMTTEQWLDLVDELQARIRILDYENDD